MTKINNITKDFSAYVSNQNPTKMDFIIGFIVLLLSYICWSFYIPLSEIGIYTTDIDHGYSAKQDDQGLYYVVDSGHMRLICFDENSEIKYTIDNVSDDESQELYINDFCIDNGLTYMAVCEWDGMILTKESILVFDKEKYVRTITTRDYTDSKVTINKPSFHGITVKDNILRYVEAQKNSLLIHSVDLEADEDSIKSFDYFEPYAPTVSGNFFDAIDDCVFNKDKLYILNKFGTINLINGENITEVYSTKWTNENNRIPYRMTVSDNDEIYFVDIRGREVAQVNVNTKSTKAIIEQTNAMTINFTKSGNEFLIVDIDNTGLEVVSNEETKTFLTLNENSNQVTIKIIITCLEIILIILLLLLIYRVYIIVSNKTLSGTRLIALVMLALVLSVSAIVCKIQVDKFSEIYRSELMSKLENSAYSVVNSVSREALNKVNTTEDYNGDARNSLVQLMINAFPMHFDVNRQIYCEFLKWDKVRDTVYTVAGSDQSVGVYFPILDSEEVESVKNLYQYERNEDGTLPVIWNTNVQDSYGNYMLIKIPIYNGEEVEGVFSLGTDASFVQDQINDLILQIVLSVIVILMLVWFAIDEVVAWIDGKKIFDQAVNVGNIKALPIHFIRLLVFLVFVFASLSATFLPVWLIKNSTEFQGEDLEFMAALPFTVNIFVIGIVALITPMLIKRVGMKHLLTIGSFAACYGNLIMFLVPGYYSIMFFGLLIEGIGNGIIMNASYILLTYIQDEEDKQRSFSVYNVATVAGTNFGLMLGSILAVLLSQRLTFLIIALMWFSMAIMSNVILLQLKNLLVTDNETEKENQTEKILTRQFLFNKPVSSFIIMFQNPYILFSGFISFFVPIFCENHGYSEVVVSILMMFQTEAMALSESNLFDRVSKLKSNMGMYIALFLNILAVMLFVLMNDVFGMVLALILMGIAAGFGTTLEQMWFMKLKPSQQYGEDHAMSIYSFTENIGESIGPMVFARLMTMEPLIASVSTFCAVVGAFGFGHMVVNKKEIAEFNNDEEES